MDVLINKCCIGEISSTVCRFTSFLHLVLSNFTNASHFAFTFFLFSLTVWWRDHQYQVLSAILPTPFYLLLGRILAF